MLLTASLIYLTIAIILTALLIGNEMWTRRDPSRVKYPYWLGVVYGLGWLPILIYRIWKRIGAPDLRIE